MMVLGRAMMTRDMVLVDVYARNMTMAMSMRSDSVLRFPLIIIDATFVDSFLDFRFLIGFI